MVSLPFLSIQVLLSVYFQYWLSELEEKKVLAKKEDLLQGQIPFFRPLIRSAFSRSQFFCGTGLFGNLFLFFNLFLVQSVILHTLYSEINDQPLSLQHLLLIGIGVSLYLRLLISINPQREDINTNAVVRTGR